MFITLLYCLFFGATICLGVPDHSSTDKETKVAKAVEKTMLQKLDWKTQSKPKKGLKEKIPQLFLDRFNKQVTESEGTGMMPSDELTSEALQSLIDAAKKIAKSMNKENKATTGRSLCRKVPFRIDFAKMGLSNSVIIPRSYGANYCDGECPVQYSVQLNHTNHAIVLAAWNRKVEQPKAKPPCCAPTKMTSIHMMFQGNDTLLEYPDMVVKECGCR